METKSVRQVLSVDAVDILNDTAVLSTPCVLRAVYVNETLSAHAISIKDNTTVIFKIPASSTGGTQFDFEDSKFNTNLKDSAASGFTGSISLIVSPLEQSNVNL